MNLSFTSGLPSLDKVLNGIMPGDNVVFQVDSIEEYLPFVQPFCKACSDAGKDLIYFRFAGHDEILPPSVKARVFRLHPENGFETFIDEIFDVIETAGKDACYVFDSLSELAVDWYSDRMLGNFFMLTCPYLFSYDTVAYFALLKNYHSFHATYSIHNTAQVIIDVYRNRETTFIHPQKVWKRSSPTMYMLHRWEKDAFIPVTMSAAVTEIFSKVPQPWLEFSAQRLGIWHRAFNQAEEVLEDVRAGKRSSDEIDYHFHKLLRMVVTRDERLLKLAEKCFELPDVIAIHKRMIGSGLVGGKSAGMLIARAILARSDKRWRQVLEEHDSFYIGSDVFYTYLVQNGCWWARRKQRSQATLLEDAEEARRKMLTGTFPQYIQEQFMEMLAYFGQSPIIVRSSSLLEDNYGNAFSGKYESVFCANRGSAQERLDAFIDAVKRAYASTMSSEALLYRAHRGLLDKDEQMALLVQRVSGSFYGRYYYPHIAGVAFSYNLYAWNSEIDPKAGMMRLVFGLGTRAVNRSDDDYTRIVALNNPAMRPESSYSEVRKYTQRKIDVLDLETNAHASCSFEDAITAAGSALPLSVFASRDEALEQYAREQGNNAVFSWVPTFDALLADTNLVPDMRALLSVLHQAYEVPVDVEFTANFLDEKSYRINIVQCRPFQAQAVNRSITPPGNLPPDRIILQTSGPIIGSSRSCTVDRLIYVNPETYSSMSENSRYAVARLIGRLTHCTANGKPAVIMLVGPGRWGTSTPSLGIPVTYAEINTVSIICELAMMHEGLVPDVSLGTHFFNDLVEADMVYLAVYPQRDGHLFKEYNITRQPNRLIELIPDAEKLADTVHVIEKNSGIVLNVDSLSQRGVCYLE